MNVQVVNGVGQFIPNGLGNLIVGYNNPRNSTVFVCSDGTYSTQAICQGTGEIWAQNHKSGSHNLVAGDRNSYSKTSGVVFGYQNAINRDSAIISAGEFNIASGANSGVSGGSTHTASGSYNWAAGLLFEAR